jgi:adenylosuccinate synthase
VTKRCYNSHAVIGLGFGDEGKGVTVNSLTSFLFNPLVVRYSGGQQAGHTVTLPNGTQHVFSNFGSGSFNGAPTYWSKYCTFDPVGVVNELNILIDKGVRPVLFVDKRSPVTTPYDKSKNQNCSDTKGHGTCGVGVGATFQREEDMYSLTAGDLVYPSVLKTKLQLIADNYYNGIPQDRQDSFIEAVNIINHYSDIRFVDDMPDYFDNIVFESSQGLLLDQNIGFFPHVTRSNVGSKNILEMGFEPKLYLVTRAFQTRHGNGPMTNTNIKHYIKDNPYETNVSNKYQGEFKRSLLDLDLLKYGIEKDEFIRNSKNRELIITCMDLVENEYRCTAKGKTLVYLDEQSFARGIANYLGIEVVQTVSSPFGLIDVE